MQLYYENERGERLDLIWDPDFIPTAVTGLGSLPSNNISTIENAIVDGVTVTNRIRDSRQITFTHQFSKNVTAARRKYIQTLDQGASGKIIFDDGIVSAYIDVDVEDCEVMNWEQRTTAVTTFFAAYPYFRAWDRKSIVNKGTTKSWVIPWTFPVTFGSLSTNQTLVIDNTGDFDTGFTVIFHTHGTVTQPRITNHRGETIYWSNSTAIASDAIIEIGTEVGRKRCLLNGANSIDRLSSESVMFPIYRGTNTLTITAAAGANNLDVEILFEDTFKGV